MGWREYFGRWGYGSRLKVCLALALFFHGLALGVAGLVMASRPEYGMAGAVAGSGNPQPPRQADEQVVDLEDDVPSDEAPVRKTKPAPTPPPQATGGALSGGALEIPSYYRNPPPPYPDEARRLEQEGIVTLRVDVDAQGKVASVAVLKSSGFPLLDAAALDTLKGWQFKPARMAGIAVSTTVNVPIRFRLKDIR